MVILARKIFVDVTLKTDKEGNTRPLTITWETGQVFPIDRVKYVCRAAALKAGGSGIRYTVVIGRNETYLFEEDGKWFVEAEK